MSRIDKTVGGGEGIKGRGVIAAQLSQWNAHKILGEEAPPLGPLPARKLTPQFLTYSRQPFEIVVFGEPRGEIGVFSCEDTSERQVFDFPDDDRFFSCCHGSSSRGSLARLAVSRQNSDNHGCWKGGQ